MSATGSAAAPERRSKGKASRAARSPGRRAKRSAAPDERAPEAIAIRGAREHNLRNVDLDLPRDQLVVITGLSGSGKSSLAFDTLYAEGQRRYVESLSAYARQFLDQMSKPDVDAIEGLSPAISIEQKTVGRSPRSTVGTTTEISDYLRLLFSRAGEPHCWSCGKPISSQTVGQMAERVLALGEGARVTVLAPIIRGRKGAYKKELDELRGKGFVRARIDGELVDLAETVSLARSKRHDIDVVIDRIAVKEGARARIAESIEAATAMADGLVTISSQTAEGTSEWGLSQANSCNDCGVSFPELAPRMFSFNSPAGACDGCSGLGVRGVFDASLVAPEPDAPLSDAIAPWRGGGRRAAPYYRKLIAALASHFEVDPKTPWGELPERVRRGILFGTGSKEIEIPVSGKGRSSRRKWDGVIGELERRIAADPDELRTLERYQAPLPCEECEGTRLRLEARSVRVGGHALHELCALPLEKLGPAIEGLKLGGASQNVAERVLFEIRERIRDQLLDLLDLALVPRRHQRRRVAVPLGATGSSDAVDVVRGLHRQVVVDHQVDVGDVQPSGCHVGGDQYIELAVAESAQRALAVGLRQELDNETTSWASRRSRSANSEVPFLVAMKTRVLVALRRRRISSSRSVFCDSATGYSAWSTPPATFVWALMRTTSGCIM